MNKKQMKEVLKANIRTIDNENRQRGDFDQYYEFTEFVYDYDNIGQFPLLNRNGIDRFLPLLPVEDIHPTLGGLGVTPLERVNNISAEVDLPNLWVKREDLNPTGCFKDRESAIVISAAVEKGFRSVHVISSGNAALSTAKYAGEVGIDCTCYIPEKTSQGKKDLITKYGAKLVLIDGFYEDVYRTVVDMNPPSWDVTSGQNPYRIEGGKTMAYEIFEQLRGVPDVIVIPSGNGGCLAATWKGFVELKKIGKTIRLPQMVCVQIKGAAPIKSALERRRPYVVLGDIDDSIAEGIVAQESYNSPQAVQALRDSGGYVIEVDDREVIQALREVIEKESIIPEPTAAATFAALHKLDTFKDALVVAVNTGSGKKMLGEIQELIQQRG